MKLLLDTHALLWFAQGDPQLSVVARAAILDPTNVKFVSPASYWEIAIKIGLGKFSLASGLTYRQFMRQAIAGNGFHILHISPYHAECLLSLPQHHRDPFDRMMIAQAVVDGMSLVSGDATIAGYGVPMVW